MTEHELPTTPEQDAQIEHLVDTADMSYALARAAVLGIRLDEPATSQDTIQVDTPVTPTARKRKPRRYHPVSKVPDADSAYDPHWNVTREKLSPEELAEQDALNAFGRAMVDNELDAIAKAKEEAARVPREATKEELDERHTAVVEDWKKVQDKIDDDLIAHPEKDPIFDPPPDRRFFDPYNRKPTK